MTIVSPAAVGPPLGLHKNREGCYMRLLDKLETTRKMGEFVIVFDDAQEAIENGFRVLYHDELCKGTVYGKPYDDGGFLWHPGVVFDEAEKP